jgi:hypothetical protein
MLTFRDYHVTFNSQNMCSCRATLIWTCLSFRSAEFCCVCVPVCLWLTSHQIRKPGYTAGRSHTSIANHALSIDSAILTTSTYSLAKVWGEKACCLAASLLLSTGLEINSLLHYHAGLPTSTQTSTFFYTRRLAHCHLFSCAYGGHDCERGAFRSRPSGTWGVTASIVTITKSHLSWGCMLAWTLCF